MRLLYFLPLQSEREAKRLEMRRVQEEVRAWRQAEVAKREARRTASKTLLASLTLTK